MKTGQITTIKEAEYIYFKTLQHGERFSPGDLKSFVCRIAPGYEFKYIDTFMRIARMYYRHLYRCVSRNKSIYEYIGA